MSTSNFSTPLNTGYFPYSEGEDHFEESLKGASTRLHIHPSTGHLKFLPVPAESALDEYYNGTFIRSLEPPTPEKEFTPAVMSVAREVRSHMQSLAPFPDDFVAHDIGCGFGSLVHAFQQIGVRASGNEQNREWIALANPYCNFQLSAEPLPKALDALSAPVDLFTILHVLEHLPNPEAALSLAAKHLSDKGLVYICVPNADSFRVLMDGRRKDPCYMFPQHLNYFTPLSLVTLLEEVGLEVVEMNTRPLFEVSDANHSRIHLALEMHNWEMIDAGAWLAAQCSSLLGGELYILATSKANAISKRDSEAKSRAQKAFRNFKIARTQLASKKTHAEHIDELRSKLQSITDVRDHQVKLIREWNGMPWYKRAFYQIPLGRCRDKLQL